MDRSSKFGHINEQEIIAVIAATMVLRKLPLKDRNRTHCWRLSCYIQQEYLAYGMKQMFKGGYQKHITNKKDFIYHVERLQTIDAIASKIIARYPNLGYLFTHYFNDTTRR